MIFSASKAKPFQRPTATSLYDLLKTRARGDGAAVAIRAPGRPDLSYSGLLGQVEVTVQALREMGIDRNDRVAIVLPNGPEMAVAFLGIGAGAACAPLNPSYRASEFDFYISDLNARAVVVAAGVDSAVRDVARQRNVPLIELTATSDREAGTFQLAGDRTQAKTGMCFSEATDTVLVLHTSGTTSRPKLVPLTHANICSSGHNISLMVELTQADCCLNVMPLFHIHGLIGAVMSSVTAGASVVCTSGFDAKRFFEWVDMFRPSWYTAVPTIHQAILATVPANRDVITRRPMRFIRSSSASLPPQVMNELEAAFATQVIESYGMTEASHQMASNPLAPLPRKAGSVGVAAGPDIAIMDEAGALLPIGELGEVVIRGTNVTDGYENNPTANQTAFTNGWFRTGDQGRFDPDGYLFLTGRLKEIINKGGEKVSPREIDDVLIEHPAVAQVVTFAVPHATLGEDIAAAVVLKPNAIATDAEIREFAAARLADFKVPRQLLILDEIPKGATGKLQRIGLADKLADKLASKLASNFVAAKSSTESQLAEIWKNLLKIDKVGVRDDFYSLGGDSLALTTMILEVEQRFKTSLPVDRFLNAPTIETIAECLQDSSSHPQLAVGDPVHQPKAISDTVFFGLRNRLLQYVALYAPGYKTTRVWLHRMRGVSIGKNVSIGLSALIETAYPRLVTIGDNVSIGMRAIIIAHLRDSTLQSRVANQPTVRIEDDAYIGPGVIILPNVTIGRGAVVSAGSVVSRSIPPRTLVRGNPAKPIAHCGVSLGGGVSYEEFLRHLTPIKGAEIS